jgi:RsiW-degrading membrane proteinase PrsW (M82 family)
MDIAATLPKDLPGMTIPTLLFPVLSINLVSVLLLAALITFIKFRKKVSKGLRFLIILALLGAIIGFSVSMDYRDFLRFELRPEGFFEGVWDFIEPIIRQ